jgi:uncharacterized UPF0146 family protein
MVDQLDITQRPYYPFVQEHLDVSLEHELGERNISSGTFLDIGTFDGSQANFLQEKGFTVTATDIDRRVLYAGVKKYPNVNFIHDDMCNSKLTDTYDYVLDRGCYHWQKSQDRQNYIRNLHKVCGELLFLKIIVDETCEQHIDLDHIQKHFGDYFTVVSNTETQWSPTGTGLSQFLVLEPW